MLSASVLIRSVVRLEVVTRPLQVVCLIVRVLDVLYDILIIKVIIVIVRELVRLLFRWSHRDLLATWRRDGRRGVL